MNTRHEVKKTSPLRRSGGLPLVLIKAVMQIIDVPLRAWQRLTGLTGMASFFLLPNMAVFTIFVLVPFVINFVYSMTGGTEIFLDQRFYVGAAQYRDLLDCRSYIDPSTCVEDGFWIATRNTTLFVVVQVALMILTALITALVLNRELADQPGKLFTARIAEQRNLAKIRGRDAEHPVLFVNWDFSFVFY